MLFNSYIFIFIFLPLTLLVYYILGSSKKYTFAKCFLILASLLFYTYNNVYYLLIICVSLISNYLISSAISNTKTTHGKKPLFVLAMFINLGILFFFKYFDFFLANINRLFSTSFSYLNIILPLGISFYTFQQISYVADVYKGNAQAYNFIDYALFVTFFPQLIAGPIALHTEMVPQFQNKKNYAINADNLAEGIYDFSCGLAKKVLIADKLGQAVDAGFASIENLTTGTAWIVMLAYTLQIYLDFSGYCNMADGIAKMFNFTLPVNFNSPYRSKSIPEFWQRWHMTLGRFLRQYIYFPLGGNRKGKFRTYFNTLVVFLISGLWHGANWTFILWGAYHGLLSCLHRTWNKAYEKLFSCFRCLLTFLAINIGWVLFRSDSISQALAFYKHMFTWNGLRIHPDVYSNFVIPGMHRLLNILLPFQVAPETTAAINTVLWFLTIPTAVFVIKNIRFQTNKTSTRKALLATFCLILSILSLSNITTFLYFNF